MSNENGVEAGMGRLSYLFGTHHESRVREGRTLQFLGEQATSPDLDAWARLAEAYPAVGIGFLALLLSNLIERRAGFPLESSRLLYDIGARLLGAGFTLENYGAWLRKGWVDVPRLAAQLDAVRQFPTSEGRQGARR